MNLDDDPKEPVPAPEGAPAGDDQDADAAPEGEEPEGDDAETPAPDEDVGDEGDDDEQDDDGGDDEDGDKPKRRSRTQRYKERADRAEAEAQALRSRQDGSLPSDQAAIRHALEMRVLSEIGYPPDPQAPEYKENYIKFERDMQAWENDRRAVSREVRKEFIGNVQREQSRVQGLVYDHKDRIARFRSRVKDFDAVMARATVNVSPHVERLILESKRSDRLTYHLAKDQTKLVRLNAMSPEAAAREIGRIEGRLSLPQPKAQTKARPPIRPLRGGGASPTTGMAAVNAYINKMYPGRK